MTEAKKTATKPKAKTFTTQDGLHTLSAGATDLNGRGPVACGEHNSTGDVFQTMTEPAVAPGFDPECEACQTQANVVAEFVYRDTTTAAEA